MTSKFSVVLLLAGLASTPALAQAPACGGNFAQFLEGVKAEAVAKGISADVAQSALRGVSVDNTVLSRDRAQGVFRQTFLEFSRRSVSANRMQVGASKMKQFGDVFARAQAEYGVPAAVITAFWGLETDFGAVQGDFNTMNALATLAHDCRRPELFRPQLIAAIEMVGHGDLDPNTTTGAWAGEIGQVQMLPRDIIAHGIDGDGDGHVDLKKSSPDAILTAAKHINALGWRAGEPWLAEVALPAGNFPYEKSGLGQGMTMGDWTALGVSFPNGQPTTQNLPADLLLPQGRNGPAFLAFPNFSIYLEWNQSFIYTVSAAYFATRLAGAKPYDPGNPGDGLGDAAMKQLQQKLAGLGHDVGKIDGILGGGTRAAVRAEQLRIGLPADGWPDQDLLNRL
ncbi:MAG: lytic murein transglycosylase [Hoeflea sp.]|uniref:lytic murein transglycosylase n=1 Tax=Hoeflea sp. TaxID=1940281 RepID=UPI001DE9C21B|nr:lytic murein transglycosylase [Hoeflea sp.]MBU4529972.1 lytic murein transglycosylase [Alphaproteobacteria bacterium]MBU4543199.1 lytic murein transglycosylase [Alphaproteobacteria bacterium]MBU4550261.1 lytic murein transglycosylase [Alphaproteobacteria bacterium]MBV1722465.1 lytic murein transglycosylase [Hoeflea sp.]MBV1761615.1 lytic murein transglycosylase [Hoeflea sp.]